MKEKLENIDKKTWIMGGIFLIVIVIVIFGGAFLYNKLFYKRTYSEVENIMVTAAKSYFNENEHKLPKNANGSITVPVETLIEDEKMDTLESYLKVSENTCSGDVKVTNVNGDYRYAAFLDCGNNSHQTTKFMDYINENVSIVSSGNGLYNLNNNLVYRGDNVNNYIKLSDKTYRIVKFVGNQPVVIYTEKMDSSVIWDNRYNIDKNDNSGINDYTVSRVRDTLNELYDGTTLLTESDKLLVTAHDVGIGRRNEKDTDKTGSLENATLLEEQYISLLPVSDFLNASTDINCTETTSPSCSNYNYLSKYKYNWWTVTASSMNSYRVFRVGGTSSISAATTNSSGYLRPVLYLVSDLIYVSGDGTSENPYIVR